jgi:glycosyltransferase involved in cell wall biosynthesis
MLENRNMLVSVIVPVYNAEKFVHDAVASALQQPETGEVILVEDGSTDRSLKVCEELAEKYEKVFLFQHPGGLNLGAGASRNLGIRESNCEYVAFLDADDLYLPGRFSSASEILKADPSVDGVYEALGEYVENEAARERWLAGKIHSSLGELTTVSERVSPGQLYKELVNGRHGHFHLDCVTVKRNVFTRTGFFNERLRLHQDTDMIWKMAAVASLLPGRLDEPVALRRIHENNRVSVQRPSSEIYHINMLLFKEAWSWGCENLDGANLQVLLNAYIGREIYFSWKQPDYCLSFVEHLCQNLPESINQKNLKRLTRGNARKKIGLKHLENGFKRIGYRYIVNGILIAPEIIDLSLFALFAELFLGKKIVNRLRFALHEKH